VLDSCQPYANRTWFIDIKKATLNVSLIKVNDN